MLSDNPNGFFLPRLNWYATANIRRAYVARGYRLHVLDSVAGSTAARNGLTQAFAESLANVPADHHFQVAWAPDGGYDEDLDRFHGETNRYRAHGTHVSKAVLFARDERYWRARKRAEPGQVRGRQPSLYLVKPG